MQENKKWPGVKFRNHGDAETLTFYFFILSWLVLCEILYCWVCLVLNSFGRLQLQMVHGSNHQFRAGLETSGQVIIHKLISSWILRISRMKVCAMFIKNWMSWCMEVTGKTNNLGGSNKEYKMVDFVNALIDLATLIWSRAV